MPTFDDLCSIAYRAERVAGRRSMQKNGLTEEDALIQVLTKAAGNTPLSALVSLRLQVKTATLKKIDARKKSKAEARAKKLAERQPDSAAWLAWFDGSTHPNPGKMGIGAVIKSPTGNAIEISFAAGQGDSNLAEYLALIAVLEEAVRLQPDQLVVYGDSQIIINEVNNVHMHGAHALQHQRKQAIDLIAQLKTVTLTWVPRKKNAIADVLSQRAIALTANAKIPGNENSF